MARHRYCLIGYPISHSLSPVIMAYTFNKLNIDAEYTLEEVKIDRLGERLSHILRIYDGFNVTMPLKKVVIQFLNGISKEVEIIDAVNTVKKGNKGFIGYNTDWIGVKKSLEHFNIKNLDRAIVIGVGGAGRAAIYALKDISKRVVALNRTFENALKVKKRFERFGFEIDIYPLNREYLKSLLRKADLVVNATPVGMDTRGSIIPEDLIVEGIIYFDMVYRPLKTPLLRSALEKGGLSIDGLWMLIYQALEAVKIWFGKTIDATELRRYLVRGGYIWRDTENHMAR